jgi:hypothetical protein
VVKKVAVQGNSKANEEEGSEEHDYDLADNDDDENDEVDLEYEGSGFKPDAKLAHNKGKRIRMDYKVNPHSKSYEAEVTVSNLHFASYFKELSRKISHSVFQFVPIKIELSSIATGCMVRMCLRKLKKGVKKGRMKPSAINLLHMMRKHQLATEYLNKKDIKKQAKGFAAYHDSLYYRLYGCLEEYLANFFDYLASVFPKTETLNLLYLLESVVPFVLIGTKLGKDQKNLLFVRSLAKNFDNIGGSNEKDKLIVQKDFVPLAHDDYVAEVIHWLSKLSARLLKDRSTNVSQNAAKLLRLSELILVNFKDFTDEMAGNFNKIISEVMNIDFDTDIKGLLDAKTPQSLA